MEKELRLPREVTKTETTHVVYLSTFARRYLARLKEANPNSEWLFPAKHHEGHLDEKAITKQITDRQRNKLVKGRSPAIQALVLPGGRWTSHDLRRTAATIMGKLGILPHVIEAVLNHKDPNKVKRIYQRHDYAEAKKEAWIALGRRLEFLLRKANVH